MDRRRYGGGSPGSTNPAAHGWTCGRCGHTTIPCHRDLDRTRFPGVMNHYCFLVAKNIGRLGSAGSENIQTDNTRSASDCLESNRLSVHRLVVLRDVDEQGIGQDRLLSVASGLPIRERTVSTFRIQFDLDRQTLVPD